MEILISLSDSKMTENQKKALENSKNDLQNAKRNETEARKDVSDAQAKGRDPAPARKKMRQAQRSRMVQQDAVRVHQQKLGRAAQIDRMVEQLDRLKKLEGTDQDNDSNKRQREDLKRRIAQARKSANQIKRPERANPDKRKKLRKL